MTLKVEAIYENGILRPIHPLEGVADQARVKLIVEIEAPASGIDGQATKPIWEVAEALLRDVPEDVLRRLPRDGAEQHDHYIYGTPKRP